METVAPPLLPQHLGKQDGADGSGGNVDDIVADEDGGEQLVVFFRHGQHPGGGRVAVLRAAFQTDLVQEENAVSEAEKKAENATRITSATKSVILPSSIIKGNHTQLSV